jgi:hypothetical protein
MYVDAAVFRPAANLLSAEAMSMSGKGRAKLFENG